MAKETNKKIDNSSKDKKHFFKDFKAELKKVIWPTPKQLINNTVAVITMVIITALIVFVLDFCFESINKYGINKLKEIVSSNQNSVVEENTSTNETTENNVDEENSNTQETNVVENAVNETENTDDGENNPNVEVTE